MNDFVKRVPRSIGIFGASGHIGGAMARWLRYHAPEVRLRLFTSKRDRVPLLKAQFASADVVFCDYLDPASLEPAVAGVEGLYVATTLGTPEERAMTNLVDALNASRSLIHMIRVVGVLPTLDLRRRPSNLVALGYGLETQHPIARRVLEDSDLPVTFFNIGASFMDNVLRPHLHAQGPGTITWHDRRVPYIDPREIGEAAARILLSDNARHIHQFHTLNNGQEMLRMRDVVQTISDVLLTDVTHDPSKEGLCRILKPGISSGKMRPDLPDYLWAMFQYEDANDVAWDLTDFLERTLGRKPNRLRFWVQEHREELRGLVIGKQS